jgi:hypothetical protein
MTGMWALRIAFIVAIAVITFLLMELYVGHWEW